MDTSSYHGTLKHPASSWLVPARSDQSELLDQNAGGISDVRANLDEMWRLNCALSGIRAITRNLDPTPPRLGPLRIVDLGTGSGKLGLYLATTWARRHRVAVRAFGVDWSWRNLKIARETIANSEKKESPPLLEAIQADGMLPPFARDSIDYVISTLFMHHFSPDALIELLRTSYRCARRGIVMSDLVRGYAPMLAFLLIQPVFARHFLTRHDGMLSIRRAYTPPELMRLAQAAGIPNAHVYCHMPWQMTLVAHKR